MTPLSDIHMDEPITDSDAETTWTCPPRLSCNAEGARRTPWVSVEEDVPRRTSPTRMPPVAEIARATGVIPCPLASWEPASVPTSPTELATDTLAERTDTV